MRRLVLSDLHIGGIHFNRHAQLLNLLEENWDEIILLGDIVDALKNPYLELSAADMVLVRAFYEVRDKLIWCAGNHDLFSETLANALNRTDARIMHSYEFEQGGKRYRLEHGHEYSGVSAGKTWYYRFAEKAIVLFQKYFDLTFGTDVQDFLRKLNFRGWWRRRTDGSLKEYWPHLTSIHKKAIAENKVKCDVFVMGHTHMPVLYEVDGLTFCNTGTAVGAEFSYVVITDDGPELNFV